MRERLQGYLIAIVAAGASVVTGVLAAGAGLGWLGVGACSSAAFVAGALWLPLRLDDEDVPHLHRWRSHEDLTGELASAYAGLGPSAEAVAGLLDALQDLSDEEWLLFDQKLEATGGRSMAFFLYQSFRTRRVDRILEEASPCSVQWCAELACRASFMIWSHPDDSSPRLWGTHSQLTVMLAARALVAEHDIPSPVLEFCLGPFRNVVALPGG